MSARLGRINAMDRLVISMMYLNHQSAGALLNSHTSLPLSYHQLDCSCFLCADVEGKISEVRKNRKNKNKER